jgi:hypothetical protein
MSATFYRVGVETLHEATSCLDAGTRPEGSAWIVARRRRILKQMARWVTLLVVIGLPVQAPAGARPTAPLELCRAKLAQGKDLDRLRELTLRPPGPKRVVFVRGGVSIAVDFKDLVRVTRRFLKKNGAERFPEERRALEGFARALRKQNVVLAKDVLSAGEQRRMDYQLATLLDRGRLEVTHGKGGRKVTVQTILVVKYSYYCGSLCGGGGRRYYLPSCKLFFSVSDWVS